MQYRNALVTKLHLTSRWHKLKYLVCGAHCKRPSQCAPARAMNDPYELQHFFMARMKAHKAAFHRPLLRKQMPCMQSTLQEAITMCSCKAMNDPYELQHFFMARMKAHKAAFHRPLLRKQMPCMQSTLQEAITTCSCKAMHDPYELQHFFIACMEDHKAAFHRSLIMLCDACMFQ